MIDREVEQAMEDAGNMPCWICQKPATGKDVLKMYWCDECYTKTSEPMTDEQREEQRRSFAYGNVALSNPDVTREIVDQQAEQLKKAAKLPLELPDELEQIALLLEELFGLPESAQTVRKAANAEAKLAGRKQADEFDAPHDVALRKVIPAKYLGWSLKEAAAEHIKALTKLIDAADYLQSCRRSEARTYRERDNVLRIKRASDHYDFLRDQVKL